MDITIKSRVHGEVTFHIDEPDYPLISPYSWHVVISQEAQDGNIRKYIVTRILGKTVYLHRLLNPHWKYVDHIDNNGLNNRRSNLRECTNSQNGMNARKQNKCTSKYKGVYWHKAAQKWAVELRPNGKKIYLGLFHDEDEAGKVAEEAYRKYFQDFALNALPDYQI